METVARETSQFSTSKGTPYILKNWLNKGENRDINKFLSRYADVKPDGSVSVNIKSLEDLVDFSDKLVDIYVVSINGDTDFKNVFDGMRDTEAQEIQDVVMNLYQGAQKKTIVTPTSTGTTSSAETEPSTMN